MFGVSEFEKEILVLVLIMSYMFTYLGFVSYIRKHDDKKTTNDNLFLINFIKIYYTYIKIRKRNGIGIGVMFFVHIVSLVSTFIFIYIMEWFK